MNLVWTISTLGEQLLTQLPSSIARTLRSIFDADAQRHEVLTYFNRHSDIATGNAATKMGRFFGSSSFISALLRAQPATYKMLELLYDDGTNLKRPIDQYLYTCPAGQALRHRLSVVVSHTVATVRSLCDGLNTDGTISVLNLGSGPGRDTITVLREMSSDSRTKVLIRCFDLNEGAIELGRSLANKDGIAERITFEALDILRLRQHLRQRADIALAIGILCGLSHKDCVRYLRIFKRYLKPGAILVASNVSVNMLEGDLFTAWILLNMIGWKLVYKTEDELRAIFEEAGFTWKGAYYDEPTRFHAMGVGLVPV